MQSCQHFNGGLCKLATGLAGRDAPTNDSACKYCTEHAEPKQEINKVTVSLSLGACSGAGDVAQMGKISQQYGKFLAPAKMPTFAERVASFTRAVAGYISKGCPNVSHDAYTKRVETCRTCKEFNGNECRVCGCFVAAKAEMGSEQCPLGKWQRI